MHVSSVPSCTTDKLQEYRYSTYTDTVLQGRVHLSHKLRSNEVPSLFNAARQARKFLRPEGSIANTAFNVHTHRFDNHCSCSVAFIFVTHRFNEQRRKSWWWSSGGVVVAAWKDGARAKARWQWLDGGIEWHDRATCDSVTKRSKCVSQAEFGMSTRQTIHSLPQWCFGGWGMQW